MLRGISRGRRRWQRQVILRRDGWRLKQEGHDRSDDSSCREKALTKRKGTSGHSVRVNSYRGSFLQRDLLLHSAFLRS